MFHLLKLLALVYIQFFLFSVGSKEKQVYSWKFRTKHDAGKRAKQLQQTVGGLVGNFSALVLFRAILKSF